MEDIITKVKKLLKLYKAGKLGGEKMPEDSNPHLNKDSEENFIYFTLPMALNYQRDSYKLWEAALKTYNDKDVCDVFNLKKVSCMNNAELSQKLTKHKLALQPIRHTYIWKTLCCTFENFYSGSVKNLFIQNKFDIVKIKDHITNNKKSFPYLSGTKILNYWLYVMSTYTSAEFKNRQEITIAPDTHVLQASVKLGIIKKEDLTKANIRETVATLWKKILSDTNIEPIDVHTPLWLWSRNGFCVDV